MQMIKFIVYLNNNLVNVELSPEFNADIIPAPQQHAQIIKNLQQKGITSKQVVSYGWANIINGKIFNIKNDYFHNNAENIDFIISKKIEMVYYEQKDNENLTELGKLLNHEMR